MRRAKTTPITLEYCLLCSQRLRVYGSAFCVLCGLAVAENPALALQLKYKQDPHNAFPAEQPRAAVGSLFDMEV